MRKALRCGLAVMVVAAALGAMVSSASANRLSISSQHLRVVWHSLIFKNGSGSARVLCPITLEGSFHSKTITKSAGSLIGFITRASIKGEETSCTGGTATVLSASLPWHISYEAFSGSLPNFTSIHILLIRPAIQIRTAGSLTCLANAETRHPWLIWIIILVGGRASGAEPSEEHTIPLTGEGGLCGLGGELILGHEETGTVTNETGAGVTVTLI